MASPLEDSLGAWQPGWSIGQQETWDRTLRSALNDRWSGAEPAEDLDKDHGWVLLGWCENAASIAVRTSDLELLETAVFGLSLVPRRQIDRRDVLLVGALIRRAVELLGVRWDDFRRRFDDSRLLLGLIDEFPPQVSPVSHRELGSGSLFRFEKIRLTQMSEEELLRRLNGG